MVGNRIGEEQIRWEILRLTSDGKDWTNADLKKRLRLRLPLSADDKARANERPNEEKWEELVNNALSPSRPKSLTAQKKIETVSRGTHRITEKGRESLEVHEFWERDPEAALENAMKLAEKLFGDRKP